MGFNAGHQGWRSNSPGSYVNLAKDSTSVTDIRKRALCPQGDNIPAVPSSAVPGARPHSIHVSCSLQELEETGPARI